MRPAGNTILPVRRVATLTSLYPASTVFLASLALGERLRPAQVAGLGLATAAVVMIVLGR